MNRQGAKNPKKKTRENEEKRRWAAGICWFSVFSIFSLAFLGVLGVLAVHLVRSSSEIGDSR